MPNLPYKPYYPSLPYLKYKDNFFHFYLENFKLKKQGMSKFKDKKMFPYFRVA
jgi:hypothetical protein